MGSPTAPSDLTSSDLEWSRSRSLRVWVKGDLYVVHIFAGSILIEMSHKGICERVGFSTVPAIFPVVISISFNLFIIYPNSGLK